MELHFHCLPRCLYLYATWLKVVGCSSNVMMYLQVWVFQRINIVSHLPGLCLQAASVNRNQVPHPSWENCDHNNVAVRCMWDNRRLHEEVQTLLSEVLTQCILFSYSALSLS